MVYQLRVSAPHTLPPLSSTGPAAWKVLEHRKVSGSGLTAQTIREVEETLEANEQVRQSCVGGFFLPWIVCS